MSSFSAQSNSGVLPQSGSLCPGFSHSGSLQLENIIEEHTKDAAAHPNDGPASPRYKDTQPSPMPRRNRSGGRNVHIFNANDPGTSVGGLILNLGVTNSGLYAMIEVMVFFEGEYVLRNERGIGIEKDDSTLLPGNYYIDSPDPFIVNNEPVLVRTFFSSQTGTRVRAFRDAVRLRDGRCVVTGQVVHGAPYDEWESFEAAHIFPLAYEQHWKDNDFARWISIPSIAGGSINSVQNGLLLRDQIHSLFDSYNISINPDDGHKIVHFGFDNDGIAGKKLDQTFLRDPQRPPDELFRWHFRQAVLVNMRGAGEPRFEHDFPPGSDIMGEILVGPKAAERMEAELFGRLATEFDLTQ